MNREFEFLKIINKIMPNQFLGDDCAYLKEYNLVLSQDTLVEDVHFSLLFMNPYEIATKALLVNISDILASGACPLYFSVALSGNLTSSFVEDFYKGLKDTAKEYDIALIGGDLTKSDKIMISITILGSSKNRLISSRKNAQDGYIAACCGEFGSSAKGLRELFEGKKEGYFINRHKKPKLYPEISAKIAQCAKNPYAMMDSSDGLLDCLFQISKKSKVRIDIDFDKIPAKAKNANDILYGGEDYSLVLAISKEDFVKIPQLIQIGSVKSGEGVYIDNKKAEYKSYEHFI